MTHKIEVSVETGITTQVEYTTEKQAIHDAAVAQQEAAAARLAAQPPAQGA